MIKVRAFVGSLSMAGVLALTACSKSDSPTAPRPSPTPSAATLTLTVSSSTAIAGQAVEARATVRQGNTAVPDGTVVNFILPRVISCDDTNNNGQCDQGEASRLQYFFIENNDSSLAKTTQNGVASAAWTSRIVGDVPVSASVGSASASATVRFLPEPGDPWFNAPKPVIYSLSPDRGSWQGGEEISIFGENLCVLVSTTTGLCDVTVPPTVQFDPPKLQAEVTYVSPDGRFVRVKTPRLAPAPPEQPTTASVTVQNNSGSDTAAGLFLYRPDVPSFVAAPAPVIYSVAPDRGSWEGGEEVAIFGQNLCMYVSTTTGLCDVTVPPTVRFNPPDLQAEVTYVSADGRMLRVITPKLAPQAPQEDSVSSVSVTNASGNVTAANIFVYRVVPVGQGATPVLYALSPNAGPIEGGTRVTIFGSGFEYPVQVLFGDREAQVVSSNFNQIVCIAPSIAPSQPGSPTVVQVQVKNILTGKVSSNTLAYRYGEAMFVSGITPNTGYILGWTPATIYGQGFVAPVQVLVDQGGIQVEAEVLSVSGTSLQVRIPPYRGVIGEQCAPVTATIKVTNLGSNLSVTGPTFTYLCSGGISGT